MRLVVALALVLAAACGSKSTPAPATPLPPTEPAATDPAPPATGDRPTDEAQDAMFEDHLVMMEEFGAAGAARKGNCPALAGDLNAIIDKHETTLAMARAWEGDEAIKARSQAYYDAREDRTKAAAEAFFNNVAMCENDEAVLGALNRLQ